MTGPTTHIPERAAPATRTNLVIGLLVGSAFVMILNETIMSVALPTLIVDLAVTASTAQWLTSGFFLTMAVVIPITGFLLQRFTPRQVFVGAMSAFSTGTLVSALAPGYGVLLTGRIVQAVGTAVMIPLLMTTVLRLVPVQRRGSMMGTISIVIAVAPAVGPTISGLILSALDWRFMFWLVLPIALLALGAGVALLRVDSETRTVPLDVASVALSAVGFAGFVYGLTAIGEAARGGALVPPWIPLVVGAAALVVFVRRQLVLQRADRALLDLRPFTLRPFVVSIVLVVLSMMALFGALILLPLYLQDVLGTDPFVTGLVVLPGGLVMGLLGPFVGRAFDRIGARPLVIPGAVVLSGSLWALTAFVGAPLWTVVVIHIVLSAGIALMLTPLMTEALGSLPADLYSHGSAIVSTLQQVAGAAGTALFVTMLTLFSASGGATDAPGIRAAFLVGAILSTAAVGVSLLVRGRQPSP
ncbi:DHA2 family efflux MFS transporter permease subunit [Pseudonocardia sp.]|uniref:DHA2 family efflux MFS transporter permease subunit n=1 Tax=Pseudonocardia sp. TaxID=60912 RepID=UPI00262774B7|nr:DHA2 family efflux MFS transporter permease subunit [Pseudonocardia sp.]